MRWWVWGLASLMPAYLALDTLASSYVTATITARPMDLVRGEERITVWLPQAMSEAQPEGTARMTLGSGAFLGLRMSYLLPDGSMTSCRHSWFWVHCRDGWQAKVGPGRSGGGTEDG